MRTGPFIKNVDAILASIWVKIYFQFSQNYIPELVREDIPQALRGQRNVIFGNIEKIFEFHSQLFLRELERCEKSPLSVGQSFLRHVCN